MITGEPFTIEHDETQETLAAEVISHLWAAARAMEKLYAYQPHRTHLTVVIREENKSYAVRAEVQPDGVCERGSTRRQWDGLLLDVQALGAFAL